MIYIQQSERIFWCHEMKEHHSLFSSFSQGRRSWRRLHGDLACNPFNYPTHEHSDITHVYWISVMYNSVFFINHHEFPLYLTGLSDSTHTLYAWPVVVKANLSSGQAYKNQILGCLVRSCLDCFAGLVTIPLVFSE